MMIDQYEDLQVIEESFCLDEAEAAKAVKASRVKNRIDVPWAVSQRIVRAIVLIHHKACYFEGMAILASLCGWKPRILENEYDPPEERRLVRERFNDWARRMAREMGRM